MRRDQAASQAAISAPRALALLNSYLVRGNVKAVAGLLKRLAFKKLTQEQKDQSIGQPR